MVTFLLKGMGKVVVQTCSGQWSSSVKDGLCFKIAFLVLPVSTPFLSGEREDCSEIRVFCFSKLSLTTFECAVGFCRLGESGSPAPEKPHARSSSHVPGRESNLQG